jgi:hypothetical protein
LIFCSMVVLLIISVVHAASFQFIRIWPFFCSCGLITNFTDAQGSVAVTSLALHYLLQLCPLIDAKVVKMLLWTTESWSSWASFITLG